MGVGEAEHVSIIQDGDGQKVSQLYQGIHCLGVPSQIISNYDRVLGFHQEFSCFL